MTQLRGRSVFGQRRSAGFVWLRVESEFGERMFGFLSSFGQVDVHMRDLYLTKQSGMV